MTFTGDALKSAILLVVGNAFIVVLAVRAFGHWAKREYGEFVGLIVSAVLVAGFVYFPDEAVNLLKNMWNSLFGGN